MLDLGELTLKIVAKTEEAENALERVGQKANETGGKQNGLSKAASICRKAFVGLTAAAAATFAILKKGLGTIAAQGDVIDKQSQKLGVTAEQYQALTLATEHCGISQTVMIKGTTKAMQAGYDNIYQFLEELEKIPNSADRAALAQEVLGTRAANELAPLLNAKDGISAYREELERLGYYSDEAVANSAAYEDALTSLNQTMTIVQSAIAEKVLPVVTKTINGITDYIAENKETISSLATTVGSVINFIVKHVKLIAGIIGGLGITSIILSIVTSIGGLITAVQAIIPVVKAVMAAMNFNPVILGITAAIAVIVLLYKNWDKVKKLFKKALNVAVHIPAVKMAIVQLKLLKAAWDLIKNAVKKAASFIIKLPGVQKAIDSFKTLKNWWDKIKKGGSATFTTNQKGNAKGGGKHRIGLKEVPYDNYSAILHKGETVLTAAETNQFSKMLNGIARGSGLAGSVPQTDNSDIYINNVLTVDGKVLSNSINKVNRQEARIAGRRIAYA